MEDQRNTRRRKAMMLVKRDSLGGNLENKVKERHYVGSICLWPMLLQRVATGDD